MASKNSKTFEEQTVISCKAMRLIAAKSVANLMVSNPYPRETLSLPDFQLLTIWNADEWRRQ
jgi:hypothetical protein